jgi:hypothetical protein
MYGNRMKTSIGDQKPSGWAEMFAIRMALKEYRKIMVFFLQTTMRMDIFTVHGTWKNRWLQCRWVLSM